jgi:hypothetical protein
MFSFDLEKVKRLGAGAKVTKVEYDDLYEDAGSDYYIVSFKTENEAHEFSKGIHERFVICNWEEPNIGKPKKIENNSIRLEVKEYQDVEGLLPAVLIFRIISIIHWQKFCSSL